MSSCIDKNYLLKQLQAFYAQILLNNFLPLEQNVQDVNKIFGVNNNGKITPFELIGDNIEITPNATNNTITFKTKGEENVIIDDVTGLKYKLGISNGNLYIEEVQENNG